MKFDEFDGQSSKAWKQRIQFELEGADFNENLVWKSLEGIDVRPFYHSDSKTDITPINPQSDQWKIGEYVYVQNVKFAQKKAIECISKGAESIYFVIPKSSITLSELLKDIDVSKISIYLELQFLDSSFIDQINALNFSGDTHVYIISDCIGHLTKSGNWYENMATDKKHTQHYCASASGVKSVLAVDMAHYQNAGAGMVQQLAYGLAHANEYLHDFEPFIPEQMVFKIAVGGNYFFEIAKLQAIRWLWESLTKEHGLDIKCHIITEPSKRNKTVYGYNINMLRTTTEIMSAALGSSNTIINLPYDALYHKDNKFGRRISRNQLLILKHESKFGEITNPTKGTYYIEYLTKQLAEKALKLFKDIEKQGGFLKQLKSGVIQKKIKEQAQKEQHTYDTQAQELVGIHVQQNTEDKMKPNLELYPFVKNNPRKTLIAPIIARRIAEPIEKERLENE
ncbi:MAG: methylmalonyl-CoA mutase subunit beta [Flavobacteriaceae bacterium]|nr:methylmalonyl-CoA mutase subunit beta [Flavobacteriaceae bacterium]